MLNRVTLVGRITRDPELRRTGNGKAVASFSLAVNRNFKSNDGQDADFISVVCWGKTAEVTAQYCSKGSLVSIDGRLQSRTYENNNGDRVFVTEVVADSVQFIDTKRKETAQAPKQTQTAPRQQTIEEPKAEEYMPNDNLDDIQF